MTARPDSTLGYTIQPKMRPDPAPQARSDAQRPGNFGLVLLAPTVPAVFARAALLARPALAWRRRPTVLAPVLAPAAVRAFPPFLARGLLSHRIARLRNSRA